MKQLKEAKSLYEVLEFSDNNNMTPILVAASENQTDIVKYLID